eukprot:275670_1
MYHLTAGQHFVNQTTIQPSPIQTTRGDYTHHPTMTQNNTIYHDCTCGQVHSHYTSKCNYQSVPSQHIQCRTNAFREDTNSQRIYAPCHSLNEPVYDQFEYVGRSHKAHIRHCCNQNNVCSSSHALCRTNINSTRHPYAWPADTIQCNRQVRQIYREPQAQTTAQCMSHSHTNRYMDQRQVSIHPQRSTITPTDIDHNMNLNLNDPEYQSSNDYPEFFETSLVDIPNGFSAPAARSSAMTSTCTLSRCGSNHSNTSNTLTDSLASGHSGHSPQLSPRECQQTQKRNLFAQANIPNTYIADNTGNEVKPTRLAQLTLPSLQVQDDQPLIRTQTKDIKSNRGRKKIDRSEFLNADGRYQCKLCPKSYKRYNDLKGHYAIHNDNTKCCPHCQKKFSRPIYLRDHIRTHTGEKPFNCDICHKQFAAKRNLVQHRKRHFRANSRLTGYRN